LLGSFQVAAEEPEEEEDNGDAIERVLWHQPKGIAEAEADEGRHAEPFVLDTDPHAELVWEEQELYIKWKGQSYLHCQWMLLSELAPVSENEQSQIDLMCILIFDDCFYRNLHSPHFISGITIITLVVSWGCGSVCASWVCTYQKAN